MTVPQAFDSLIAKLIVTGASRAQALERARRALAEFEIDGMPTVLPFHRAVVSDPAFTSEPFTVHTRWIETEFAAEVAPYSGAAAFAGESEPRERITVEVGGKRLEVTVPAGLGGLVGGGGRGAARGAGAGSVARPRSSGRRGGGRAGGHSGDELVSPMQGTIVKIVAADGEQVEVGDTIVVLEAMKMEQPLTAHKAGTVTGLSVSVGQTVPAGAVICQLS
jgi:acetyl-CoA/propionyl-CoA carboxylase biotin carboxyl carrier protein